MTAPAFVGFTNASGQFLFPVLFVSVACGALSGFHSLVSSGTSSKQVSNETDASPSAMAPWSSSPLSACIAIVIAAIMYKDMNTAGLNGAAPPRSRSSPPASPRA
jgi:carbon starvation protein